SRSAWRKRPTKPIRKAMKENAAVNSSTNCSPIQSPATWPGDWSNGWHPASLSPAALAWWATRKAWKSAKHLATLDRLLVDAAVGRERRVLVTMPPRHGKSMLVSHFFPAWYLGVRPTKRVMLASYSNDFAATWGRKVRDVIQEFGRDVFGISLKKGSTA